MKSKSDKNQVATKKDVNLLKGELKEVKGELKGDIKKLDIKVSATRSDLKRTKSVLWQELLKVEGRLEGVEEGQKGLDLKLDRIQNTLDGFVGTVDDLRKENTAGADLIEEVEIKVVDHEKRIANLEAAV